MVTAIGCAGRVSGDQQRIVDVEAMLVPTRPAVPWGDALGSVDALSLIVVRIASSNGVTGVGLSYTVGPGGEAIHTLIESCLAQVYLGTPLHGFRSTWHEALRVLRRAGTGGLTTMAMAAMDIAVWDALAIGSDLPLCAALGGSPGPVRTYGSGIDLPMEPDQLVADVQSLLQAGYTAIKIKVGRPTLAEDIDRLAAVRESHPMSNSSWTQIRLGRSTRPSDA